MHTSEDMLIVKNVQKQFGTLEVLKDISFEVKRGEVVAIIGPSGSGKSTLLRCINQLDRIDSGEITVCGETLAHNDAQGQAVYASPEVQKSVQLKLGLVFQNFNLFPHLSIMQNLIEAPVQVLKQNKQVAEAHVLELLAKLGLTDKAAAYPFQLSGGQQQRVSIARALALNPAILCFDEPTSALDPELTGEVLRVIRDLAKERMTMLVVTHEMRFAEEVADYVIFIDRGLIIEAGTPDEIFNHANEERTKQFLAKIANA